MIVMIKRQDGPGKKPYWQEFEYQGDENQSVEYVLDYLNFEDDLFDIEHQPARRISWECSCMQGICGACGMLICGKPALACTTFLKDIKEEVLVLEPLKKFPVIADLVVDKSIMQQHLLEAELYIEKGRRSPREEQVHRYATAKCLKCGLCLEACSSYNGNDEFHGAIIANDAYLLASGKGERTEDIGNAFVRFFENGCTGCGECMKVCPLHIPTKASAAKMMAKYVTKNEI